MERVLKYVKEYFVFVVVIAMIAVMGAMKPDVFLTPYNFFTILRQVSISGIMVTGLLFVMLAGGIDLSIGAIIAVSSVFTAKLIVDFNMPVVLAGALVMVLCTLIGFAIGFIIVKTKIFPMIGTLALMGILSGLAFIVCRGLPIIGLPKSVLPLGQGFIPGTPIPIPVVILFVVLIAASFILNKTYIGRYFYLVGGNPEAARLSGINTELVQIVSYGISGALCSFGGIIMMSRINSGAPTVGPGMEMDVLTAAVIGGVSLMGGEGKVSKAFGGVLIIGILTNGLTILNVDPYLQKIIIGFVFLVAVCFDGLQKNIFIKGDRKRISAKE
ncbi:MAG: ABC transporter permease [Clostridiales Family XIII bacterium]|jgi:ribose/xylose/arabinose/galactoside ABC-type transport system permease subunit|nr:ABC transporter permease [Clostridiales Family XIII bacterium]